MYIADTANMSIRNALRKIRADLNGRSHLSGCLFYDTARGMLVVSNRAATDGQGTSYLSGQFVAELTGNDGRVIRRYNV